MYVYTLSYFSIFKIAPYYRTYFVCAKKIRIGLVSSFWHKEVQQPIEGNPYLDIANATKIVIISFIISK